MTNGNGNPFHAQKEKKYGLKLVNGKKLIFDYSIWKFMF
jgi:hypothetical protein